MKKVRNQLLLLVILSVLSISLANNYVQREFNREYFIGDIITIELELTPTVKTDIAEYIPFSIKILNWTTTPNVKVEKTIRGNNQVMWFDIEEGETKITYTLLPKYAGVYELTSIITTPEGFEKEVLTLEVKRRFDWKIFKWVILLMSLILFLRVIEKESVKEQ